jgi:hypothetical protein
MVRQGGLRFLTSSKQLTVEALVIFPFQRETPPSLHNISHAFEPYRAKHAIVQSTVGHFPLPCSSTLVRKLFRVVLSCSGLFIPESSAINDGLLAQCCSDRPTADRFR